MQNRRFLLCPLPHALDTHYFMRLTRARGKRYIREGNALLYDFWYFWSRKSTIKEKFLYVSSRANNVRPLSRRRQHTCFAYVLIPPTMRVVEGADPYKIKPQYSQKKKQKICTLSRQRTCYIHARHAFICGRADNACTNLLGFFV